MNEPILNLTQHKATPDQVAAGVTEPSNKAQVQSLLTFEFLPCPQEVVDRAVALTLIAEKEGAKTAMIGGAPFLMGPLESALQTAGITPVYAFSVREVVEAALPGGQVTKTAIFRHVGFVEAL